MARILTVTLNPALDMTMVVDVLTPGTVHRVRDVATHAAGKGINVAQALDDLGHTLTVAGFLGRDNAGMFEQLFKRRGWRDVFLRVAGDTRCNVKVVERRASHPGEAQAALHANEAADGRNTDLNSPGFEVGVTQRQQLAEQLCELAADHDAVIFAGSLPPGIDIDWFGTLLMRIKHINHRIAVDTSGAALAAVLASGPWLVKPNVEELVAALNLPADDADGWRQAAADLVAGGIANVVVSDGAAGVSWWSSSGAWHALPPAVTVRSTVGAGDTLLAGMVHALIEGTPPDAALRLAAACGTFAVTQVGYGLPDMPALDRIEQQVTVSPLTTTPTRARPS